MITKIRFTVMRFIAVSVSGLGGRTDLDYGCLSSISDSPWDVFSHSDGLRIS